MHARHILDISSAPVAGDPAVLRRARELARALVEQLQVVGLLCVELFEVGGELLVNEIAPRPHNSGHLTLDACATSQFEQHIRAVCGLPLGDPVQHTPAAMANLLGDLWPAASAGAGRAAVAPGAGRAWRQAASVRQARGAPRPQDGAPHRPRRQRRRGGPAGRRRPRPAWLAPQLDPMECGRRQELPMK